MDLIQCSWIFNAKLKLAENIMIRRCIIQQYLFLFFEKKILHYRKGLLLPLHSSVAIWQRKAGYWEQ